MLHFRYTVSIVTLSLAANVVAAQQNLLPSESELPRQVVQRGVELPSESKLPESHLPVIPLTKQQHKVEEPKENNALPSEGKLPPGAEAALADPAGALPLQGSPDGIPWLRLNFRGHTAPLRASAFLHSGNRFCTAGDDKSVIVWAKAVGGLSPWRYERTIRWQVQRGSRGRIYALAAAPKLLALTGEGAMGGTGEIVLVDPTSGDFVATLFDEVQGHRQVVVSLDFVTRSKGSALASHSMDGRTLLWNKSNEGVWQARVAIPDDRTAGVEPDLAKRLLAGRGFSAAIAVDFDRVIVPRYHRTEGQRLVWQLALVDLATGAQNALGGARAPGHLDSVVALAADTQRTRLVSADGQGRVYIWDLATNPPRVRRLNRSRSGMPLSISLSSDGKTLAVGTTVAANQQAARVEIWDLAKLQQPRLVQTIASSRHVLDCAVSPHGKEVVFSRGDAAIVQNTTDSASQTLRGTAEKPLRVAFAADEPFYRIGVGTRPKNGGEIAINQEFDTDRLQLTRIAKPAEHDWLSSIWGRGTWRIAAARDSNGQEIWRFEERGQPRAKLPLAVEKTGAFSSVCWIPGDDLAIPELAAVGTTSGEIFVVKVTDQDEAPIVRRFRGHFSGVVSLAVSRDRRWLASASADATVRVWPLGPVASVESSVNRWGAVFEVDKTGKLVIASIRDDGPLFFRGARQGDQVVSGTWLENGERRTIEAPNELRAAIAKSPWDQNVEFQLQTERQASRSFQILPAWQQVASLIIDSQGEWAYWAPAGYYDASFEGHRLFGWQINRGVGRLPDYFLAAQFRQVLERPAVMSRLLRSGSIEAAFRAARVLSPADSAQTLANTYRLKPEVEILSPLAGSEVADAKVAGKVRARIRIPAGQTLARAKAFANGVVAPPGRLLEHRREGGVEIFNYEWTLAVPADLQVLVQVVAATDTAITAEDRIVLSNTTAQRTVAPRLYLLAAGVDRYRDAQIPQLRTPVAHTKELAHLLQTRANGLYQVEATSLLNERATRPAWTFLTRRNAELLRESASPDDLIVFYLSGHGVQDASHEGYHFITADADFADTMAGRYADCLSFQDFAQFADISCRKLVVLDTCHSGAIQPMRHREIKLAVRVLQEDLLMTLAASDGSEEAVEGRFSTRLLEALAGAADRQGGNRDGVVALNEVVDFLKRTVEEDSQDDVRLQTPSAGPSDLLPFVSLPLSSVAPGERLGPLERRLR